MSTLLSLIIAPTRAWTAIYTLGLPADVRAERHEEIDCDLWEHQRLADLERNPVTGTAIEMLLRLVIGAPADIFWRLEAGASARSGKGTQVNDSLTTRGLFILAFAVAALPIIWGISRIGGEGGGGVVWGLATALAGVVLLAGLLLSHRSPGLGLRLVAAGAIAVLLLLFWMFFIVIPLVSAIVAVAYFRARRTGWRLRSPRPA